MSKKRKPEDRPTTTFLKPSPGLHKNTHTVSHERAASTIGRSDELLMRSGTKEDRRIEGIMHYLSLSASAASGNRIDVAKRFLDLASETMTESERRLLRFCWSWYPRITGISGKGGTAATVADKPTSSRPGINRPWRDPSRGDK